MRSSMVVESEEDSMGSSMVVESEEDSMRSRSKSSSRGSNNEEDIDEDVGDSSCCYYPGCKKNVNCKCEICLESINATLDLMPPTKLSASKPIHRNLHSTPLSFHPSLLNTPTSTPLSFHPSLLNTPTSTSTPLSFHPSLLNTPTSTSTPLSFHPSLLNTPTSTSTPLSFHPSLLNTPSLFTHKNPKKASSFYAINSFFSLLLPLAFLLSADIAFPWLASTIFQPSLSPHVVKTIADKCWHLHDWNAKLRSFQKDLMGIADAKKRTYSAPKCEIIQDGLLLNSRCTLYKSAIEEVTIWGWPMQTAGLLTNGFSFRSFTILSGRVTQWNAGQVGYLIRNANSSWVQSKLGASLVQLDPNTWVLEYQRSSICNSTRLYTSANEFLKYRTSRIVSRLKKCFWRFAAAFEDKQFKRFTTNNGVKIPT
ncbi:unnamed protein product [Lupinus luteus]|uniref:Uncharacterized protein n=1 Tax=Lupinus luteus TaxID=3873 RepID=A0AAV1VV46_LUPLU